MPDFVSVFIIFNPNSTGDAETNAKQLKDSLAKSLPKIPVTLLPTSHAGHAIELAYDTACKAKTGTSPLIISASGDGGYNEVINGALRAQQETGATPICAVLPSGNANDHARTVHTKPLAAAIVNHAISKLDVLEVTVQEPRKPANKRYAHSYVGLGITPAVAVELNKHTLNSLKEAWIVTRTFWNLRPVVVKTADKTLQLDSLICSIIPEMAKVLTLSDKAQADDGKFEITSLPHKRKWLLIYYLLRGVFKHMDATSRAHDYSCTVLSPVPIQLDGEIMELPSDTKLKIALRPGLLRTIR